MRAADAVEARLELERTGRLRRLAKVIGAFAIEAVGLGGSDALPGFDLVIVRRDSGAEIHRTRAGGEGEAQRLLASVEAELDALPLEDFLRGWHLFEN
ncbi:hypothetical protein [Agromyces archimandritae]|uniref:Uncharacterized protein n=1 Tax=Agromyces archimandritae TaxID=2781962 RepID=A0A975IMX0_9MICO|nr:hypothetical protein [Agromyces archimandritae]QTX03619.1 hypothetical protein G127AT_09715 [Agromyces archimandritae]